MGHISKEDRALAREATWLSAKYVIGAIVFVLLIAAAIWGLKVAVSDVKGKGDAERTKNSSTNRIEAQEGFEQKYQDFQAAVTRVGVMADAYDRDPSTVNSTNLTGAVNFCIQLAADYNADARKFTQEEFRSADLPESLDSAECQPEGDHR